MFLVSFHLENIPLLFISLGIRGIYQAASNPGMESIFADSIVTRDRSGIYSLKYLLECFGNAVGPFTTVLLYLILGNEWNVEDMKLVLVLGVALSVIPHISLFYFNDDKSLGRDSEAIEKDEYDDTIRQKPLCGFKKEWIPYVLVFSDIVSCWGAGMSAMFFPLFFISEYGFSPAGVNLIFGCCEILIGFCSILARFVSRCIGRGKMWCVFDCFFIVLGFAILLFYVIGVGLLFIFARLHSPWIAVFVFLGEEMAVHCPRPLERSILMDCVEKKQRGKWNAVESISSFSWTVSALIGGIIADSKGYRFTFMITFWVYIVALIPFILIIPFIPKERKKVIEVDPERGVE